MNKSIVHATNDRAVLHTLQVGNHSLSVFDTVGSCAARLIEEELRSDTYCLRNVPLDAGDVIIDLGGHVGIFAIYIARLCPACKIHSFEPYPFNAELFEVNLKLNDVGNVSLHRMAVSADGRALTLSTNPHNSGAATACSSTLKCRSVAGVPSTTLDAVFRELIPNRCKLLKIDCEGMEHEILHTTTVMKSVDYLRGEFHINDRLLQEGYSIERLAKCCLTTIDKTRIKVKRCKMSE